MKVKLVGNQFGNSIGLAGDRKDEHPKLMQWDRSASTADDVVVFTDSKLRVHKDYPAKKRIALIAESPAIRPGVYDWIQEHFDEFDVVLTHQRQLVELGYPFLFYPLGGSWIKEWGMFPKTKMFSLLVSRKVGQEGHRLRHEAAKLPGVDVFGEGVGKRVMSKAEALRDYRFVIVAENCISDAYFTEKLVDAMSQGCVVLYRGCPNIWRFFNQYSVIPWGTIAELESDIEALEPKDYETYSPHVKDNLARAEQYAVPEDWIVKTYKGIFDG